MTAVPHGDIARRFPLVPRPRPACLPLNIRIGQLTNLATAAVRHLHDGADPQQAASSACETCNFGALIASDCGMPDLAAVLCRKQLAIWRTALPLTAQAAKLALQPLVNLGRLRLRSGDGAGAHRLISELFTAVEQQSVLTIGGDRIDLRRLTRTSRDHRDTVQWLSTVLLADGTRALAQSGQWDGALKHIHSHHGISLDLLLDGRQVAIIALHQVGEHETAARLLMESAATAPWEQAVKACLGVLTQTGPSTAMIDSFRALGESTTPTVFRTRLGLAVVDLSDDATAARLAELISTEAQQAKDAYAGQEILAHQRCVSFLPATIKEALNHLMNGAALQAGTLPDPLHDEFTSAMTTAETTLAQSVRQPPAPSRRPRVPGSP